MSCIKYILFVFNFIFVLFGGLLVYFGVEIIREKQSFQDFLETPNTLAIGVIVVGVLVCIIAFLGCCGSIIESPCILLSFGIVVTVILALELTIAGLAFAFKTDVRTITNRELRDAIQKYNWTDPASRFSMTIDQMQSKLKCCGYNSTWDWSELNPNPRDRQILPDSCCPPKNESHQWPPQPYNPWKMEPAQQASGACRLSSPFPPSRPFDTFNRPSFEEATQTPGGPYNKSCADELADSGTKLIGPIGLACLAIALFQILGIIFAFSLARAVRREYQVV